MILWIDKSQKSKLFEWTEWSGVFSVKIGIQSIVIFMKTSIEKKTKNATE